VQVLPLQRSYPWLLISSEAMMTNAALMAVGATNVLSYTLPASNDQYVIYFQFADNGTNAVCDVFGKIVGFDTVPPTVQITGPTTNATGTGNQLFIHLQATVCDSKVYNAGTLDSARPLKVWLNGNPYWGRRSGQLDIPRFRVQPNTNNVITILAQDTAGNTNAATLTWTVNGNGDTTAPVLSNFNVAAYTLLPDMEQVWIQADCDDSNAVVRAQVTPADGDPSDPWNMTWLGTNGFGTHVPLAWGTNTLQMVAFDAAGNATTNSFILERSDRYTAQMTSPEPGTFAAGDEYVSGRVGKLIDVGLPTETTVTNVAINGVLVELMDWGDEFLWVSTNAVNGSSLRRVWPVVMTLYLADNTTRELPLGLVEGYEIVIKRTDSEFNEPEYDTTSDGSYTSYPYMWWFLYLFEPWAFGTDNESSTWLDPDGITNEEAWSSLQPSVPPIDRGSNTGWLWWPAWVGSDSLGDGGRALFLGWATDHYTWQWWVNDFWSRKDWPWEARADGFMVFRAPLYCGTGTTVLLTLQGVGYRYDGVSDLSQVKLWGQSPVAWSNEIGEVSYLVTLDKDTLYTFGPDSFTWPEGDSWTTNEIGTLDGFPTKSVETWHGHRIWFTDFHNELPPLEVKVTNGPEKHGGVKPWVNNQTGEAWVGISMFPTPTFKNKDAFVVLKVEHEWKNLTNAAGQAFVPSQLGYDPIYYVRRFSTDVDAKMSGEETTQHTNYVRGLYFALVDSCTNRPAEWQGEPPCLESCITNSTGNVEINFTYMVYEGTPDVKSLGFENTHYWLDYITDWGKFRAYANEASHGVSSFVEPSPDKLKRYKMLGGTKNHKLLLKWNTRSEPNRQQLIRTPYIEDGPNRFGR